MAIIGMIVSGRSSPTSAIDSDEIDVEVGSSSLFRGNGTSELTRIHVEGFTAD
jgi:hypothetical protein